ncbi:DUF4358 domain-containing protein [Candidatus Pseudoruminococcus sp.]|uniref:DUF4358 domain-containing protein n=1 Tax=Candidatus Pseudoruminococcus sp. TaxID=3101048 RepID=UPI0039999F37
MTINKRKVIISVSLILSIIAVAAIIIAFLIHMGFGKPLSNKEQTDVSISTDTIVDRIIGELDYSGISRVSSDNISKYYDIDEKLISEATVYISDSADSCFEVSCFKLNDENDYSKVESKIKNHINSQSANLQILNPKESKKLGNTKIEYCNPYILVVVADNSESAITSFRNFITGKVSSGKN